ncbi:hypothetical protein EON63_03150 [archaeon]|nr:MAG: hypothetical protein EON63_03150 [archaeon]
MLPGRTPLQCLYRWKESLNPKIRKGYWSAEVRHEP